MRVPGPPARHLHAGYESSLCMYAFTRLCAVCALVFFPLTGNSVVQSGKSFPGK